MAEKKNERQMLFDLRGGRRGKVVKVVYATLAVLMGLSLFLVIGGFNIAELFEGDSASDESAQIYEEQAERIEAKLVKNPTDPKLLGSLTRTQINAGNAQVTVEPNGARQVSADAAQEYQKAYQSWTEYLKATPEPEVGLALLVAPMLLQLAELATSYPQADSRVESAVEAQQIVAAQRPTVNAWTTLAYYAYFTDPELADKARAEAKKLAGSKAERESIDEQLDEFEKNADRYRGAKAKFEKEQKEGAATPGGEAGAPPSTENPLGGFGGGGLGE
ncbi:MAG TPA: hypothetical protein VFR75_01865 [Solirubrobacterales bacterium]|nr:hypothetical protein [Solirubrobacterales bacterium]